ncbi:MAG TPA: hypothetical protein VN778_03945 [Verrucomicrobiae bacterium]|nr:hypothetical protein [Verrucomicrobiae bacterium]
MKQILVHHRFGLIILLLAVDSLFFGLTSPQKVASWLLVVGVLLFLTSLYYFLLAGLTVARWYGLPTGKRPRRLAKVLVGTTGFLVALQSIGELSSRDVLVLLPLGVIVYLYSYRAIWRSQPSA